MRKFLLLCIFVVTLAKTSLMGSGFLSLQDERRYEKSGFAIEYLSKGDIRGCLHEIFSTKGRPGETIIKTLPNAIQIYTARLFHLNVYETRNAYPLFVFNFIIFCLILFVHYKFSKLILKDECLSLLSVLIYGSLTNSYLYLRHALPYDMSLLILYFALYKATEFITQQSLTNKKSFILGLSAFIGYSVYPGYFPLLFLIGMVLLYNRPSNRSYRYQLTVGGSYLLGILSILVLYETLSRIGNSSFVLASKGLSGTIVQGSFEESYSFLYKYLWEAEGIGGKVIGAGLLCYFIYLILKVKTLFKNPLIYISSLLIIAYTCYATMGYLFHQFVFYGRLLHMYYPFICIVCVYVFNMIVVREQFKKILVVSISLLFVFSFYKNFIQYKTYSYPRDIGWKYINIYGKTAVHNLCEYTGGVSQIPARVQAINHISPSDKIFQSFYYVELVNCCYHNVFQIVEKNPRFYLKKGGTLIESLSPFYNFKAYQYEGYSIEERRHIDSLKQLIKVYAY